MRSLFTDDHQAFRESFAAFVAKEMSPHYAEWERAGIAPRDLFTAAGKYGFLGIADPRGVRRRRHRDFRFNLVIGEELAAAGIGGAGLGLTLHNDICMPYFLEYCTDEQTRALVAGHRCRAS